MEKVVQFSTPQWSSGALAITRIYGIIRGAWPVGNVDRRQIIVGLVK